jgi:single-strand DNA-binding protein
MTIAGNVCDEPEMRITPGGHAVTNFRIASTPRRFDRESNTWVDGDTLFVSVACWRALAENVKRSLHKGQPVVVYGRYYCRPYVVDEAKRIAYQLEAQVVGHDLNRGTAEFAKVGRPGTVTDVPADADGLPENPAAQWFAEIEADETVAEPRAASTLAPVG